MGCSVYLVPTSTTGSKVNPDLQASNALYGQIIHSFIGEIFDSYMHSVLGAGVFNSDGKFNHLRLHGSTLSCPC